jgi:hypothetical protein
MLGRQLAKHLSAAKTTCPPPRNVTFSRWEKATRRLGFCGPSLSLRASSRVCQASLGIGFPEGEIVGDYNEIHREVKGDCQVDPRPLFLTRQ